MDDLPSYEAATCPNAWTLIAPYLPSQALCSAALVSREWNKIFTPWLWGSPASHFGEQNDVVFVALTRFKRILSNARASVCELTHTLCLPPAHAEIYSGPHSEWLRDCLEYLPRLQCLIVNGLPFFDHASLLSLRYPSQRLRPKFPVFSLRLLDASGCMNATSAGLAEALPHFPDLVSLDLSKTRASRGKAVLSALKHLLNLRVLNLCGIGLKDEDFSIVAHSIRSRVRSLDISNNLLTDTSTRLLLELCLKEIVITPHTHRGRLAPVEQEQGNNEIDVFESENLVGPLRKKLMGGFVGTLPIEEARDVGISHLYLSANNITIEGISSLLRSGRLKVLDAGVLPATIRNPYPVDPSSEEDDMKLPSVAKLVPILSKFARHKLRYVRLNYQIATENAPIERSKSPRAELCGGPGAYERPEAHELENTELSMSELDSEFTTVQEIADYSYPIELPGSFPPAETSNHASSSTAASGHKPVAAPTPAAIITSQPPLGQQESPNYRNQTGLPLSPISPLQQSFENHRGSREGDLSPSWSPSLFPPTPTPDMQFPSTLVFETICQEDPLNHVEDMKVRLSYRQSQEPRLHPGMLPNLHTLVLTSVPIAAEKYMVDRIIQFIKDAADEASIARQSARNTYALPPGRRRVVAEEEYAHSLFALRRIVLEMASPQPAPKKISTSWRAYPTRSTTEDADSEAFWEAASHDFSFFGDEECGQPSQQLARPLPLEAMSGLELATDHTHPVPEPREPEVSPRRLFDVIGEVGKFRRERKAAYEELVATGEANPDVKGYWPGDITVVRMPLNAEVGELDCYGNRYESGWYYR